MLTQIPERRQIVQADAGQIYALLQTSPQGLTSEEAARRLQYFGPNIVSRADPYPIWRIIVDQFASPIIYVLLIAAGITFFLKDYKDTIVILAVVVLNAIIGFWQEFRATRAMEALRQLAVPVTTVRRDGHWRQISSVELVPGDVVAVEAGMRAAADMRLIRAVELQADESQLTGESVPVYKQAEALSDPEVPLADTFNMIFAGSMIVEGRGEAVVVATGPQSELGKIAQAVAEVKPTQTPLQKRLHRMANTLVYGIVILVFVTMGIGILRGLEVLEMFMAGVALAVAVIPEGLPIVVTVVLSMGVRQMARRNVLVRKLAAAETLGSVDVICSDKTGTITQNHMTVQSLVWGNFFVATSPETPLSCPEVAIGSEITCPLEEIEDEQLLQSLRQLLRIAAFCNNAEYAHDEAGTVHTAGSPTEIALLEAAAVLAPEVLHEREIKPPLSEVPFSSARKFMATVQQEEEHTLALYVKGAPEVILPRCTEEWEPLTNGSAPLRQAHWLEVGRRLAGQGQRVVAVARRPWPKTNVDADEIQDLILYGLIGMSDPPRPEAASAIRGCRESGIRVIIVTGDHPETAAAIAQQIQLISPEEAAREECVISGAQLAQISEEEFPQRLEKACVFARVTPHDKLRIVEALQRQQHVVAVTGDGVNDAPALRRAEIGVAMGRGGTEAAREAADLVLLDDSFASIYEAVKVGRYIFENIRKVVFFLLSSGAGAIIAVLGALLLGWPIPFLPAQILWINLVTNGLQDVALAFEPGESFTVHRPPYGTKARIFDRIIILYTVIVGIVFGVGTLAVFYYVWVDSGENVGMARTAAATCIVLFQLWHAWSCRSLVSSIVRIPIRTNPFLMGSLAISFGAQQLFVYWMPMQKLFDTIALPAAYWLYILVLSFSGVLAMELGKIVVRRQKWHLRY